MMGRLSYLMIFIFCIFLSLKGVALFDGESSPSQVQSLQPKVESFLMPIITEQTFTQLNELVGRHEETPQANDSSLMNAQQQAQQSGELFDFFIGEQKLQLKAIIDNSGKRFALIAVKDLKSGEEVVERYVHGQNTHGYDVEITEAKSVNFKKSSQEVTLLMYESKRDIKMRADK